MEIDKELFRVPPRHGHEIPTTDASLTFISPIPFLEI